MRVREVLEMIPVYPESIKIPYDIALRLDSSYPICEDEKGLSWVSEEAKLSVLGKKTTQSKPKQKPKQEVKKYTVFGKTQTLRQWAEEYGINYQTLQSRIHSYDMSLEKALTFKYQRRLK